MLHNYIDNQIDDLFLLIKFWGIKLAYTNTEVISKLYCTCKFYLYDYVSYLWNPNGIPIKTILHSMYGKKPVLCNGGLKNRKLLLNNRNSNKKAEECCIDYKSKYQIRSYN